jgi:hypothetical protein
MLKKYHVNNPEAIAGKHTFACFRICGTYVKHQLFFAGSGFILIS